MDMKWSLVMVVGVIIGFIGKKNQSARWGQAVLLLGALIAIAGAICNIVGFAGSGNQAVKTENRFRYIQGKILAQNIKKSCSPSKVCVIVSPSVFLDKYGDPLPERVELGFLEGVEDALGSCQVVPVYPEYKYKQNAAPDIPYPYMPGKDFKKVAEKIRKEKPDCVINTYMFPVDVPLTKALAELKGYKVGMLNTDSYKSNDNDLRAAFKDGGKSGAELLFVVQQKPNLDSEVNPASDQKAFDYRYVMLTKDNYEQGIQEANQGRK